SWSASPLGRASPPRCLHSQARPCHTGGVPAPIDWLLDSDPALRWQVMRDLASEPPAVVAAERARVATEGWGAGLLALQAPDGRWDGGTYRPGWVDESKPFFDAWTAT